jgi:hypothetical protein
VANVVWQKPPASDPHKAIKVIGEEQNRLIHRRLLRSRSPSGHLALCRHQFPYGLDEVVLSQDCLVPETPYLTRSLIHKVLG